MLSSMFTLDTTRDTPATRHSSITVLPPMITLKTTRDSIDTHLFPNCSTHFVRWRLRKRLALSQVPNFTPGSLHPLLHAFLYASTAGFAIWAQFPHLKLEGRSICLAVCPRHELAALVWTGFEAYLYLFDLAATTEEAAAVEVLVGYFAHCCMCHSLCLILAGRWMTDPTPGTGTSKAHCVRVWSSLVSCTLYS